MQLKKGIFSYINLTIGFAILSVYLYTLFVAFIDTSIYFKFLNDYNFKGIPIPCIISCSLIVIFVGFFFIISAIKSLFKRNPNNKLRILSNVLYWVICAFTGAFIIYLRVSEIIKPCGLYTYDIARKNRIQSLFLGNVVSFDNILNKMYSFCVLFFYRIFGLKDTVIMSFNLILFVCSIIFTFFAIKNLFGKFASVGALLVMCATNLSLFDLYNLSGKNLWFFFLTFFVFVFSYFFEDFGKKYPVTGFLIEIALFFFILAIKSFVYEPFVFGTSNIINQFWTKDFSYVEILIIISIFALYGYLYVLKNNTDKVSCPNIVFMLLLAYCCVNDNLGDNYFIFLAVLGIISGFGLEWLLTGPKKNELVLENSPLEESEEYIELIAENADQIEKSVIPAETKNETVFGTEDTTETPIEEVINEKVEVSEDESSSELVSKAENTSKEKVLIDLDTKTETAENLPKEPRKIVFIDNPLPLPKKHVKKDMSYPIEPDSTHMKYDIDVSENDDYDH